MIQITAKFLDEGVQDNIFVKVDDVVHSHADHNSYCRSRFGFAGYEGIFNLIEEDLGITKAYRHEDGYVVYEFSDEDWVTFALKYF